MKLVLLPGMDGTGDLFRPLLHVLPAGLEPLVVSYPTDQRLTYAKLTNLVRSMLPDNETFLLLGESFSGPIAIRIASERPAGLKALYLCCTFSTNPHPQFRRLRPLLNVFPIKRIPSFVSEFILLGAESTHERRDEFEAALEPVDPAVIRLRAREALSIDVTDRLNSVEVPTVYLRATDDRVVPKSASEHIQGHLPDMRIVDIEGPHFLIQTKPQEIVSVIQDHIANSESAIME